MPGLLTRRRLLTGSTTVTTALLLQPQLGFAAESGRLAARPAAVTQALQPGEHVLNANAGRRTLLYIPASYRPSVPVPLVLMLHGARGDGDGTLASARAAADSHGVILLCPSTQQGTWDAIRGDFGRDFKALDEALQQTFSHCHVDPAHLAVGGFSDGASYGLSLGLINGDLFTHAIAHSPGFIIADNWHGKPKVYVSHGRQDQVLPFERCGAAIVARLQREGYAPRFDVFAGGHTASAEIRSAALEWLTQN